MKRVAIVATLKPGAHENARKLLEQGPPFDLGTARFERHFVFLSTNDVVFVFEGGEVEWRLDDLLSDFLKSELHERLGEWRALMDGSPRIATEAYFWEPSEG